MSVAKFNALTLGNDQSDITKRYTWRINPDPAIKTVQLVKGEWDDVDAPVVATFDENGLVDPRTLQDKFSERDFGTPYLNDTGMAIDVWVSGSSSSPQTTVRATIGALVLDGPVCSSPGFNAAFSFTVPDGFTYTVVMIGSAPAKVSWAEYRKGP